MRKGSGDWLTQPDISTTSPPVDPRRGLCCRTSPVAVRRPVASTTRVRYMRAIEVKGGHPVAANPAFSMPCCSTCLRSARDCPSWSVARTRNCTSPWRTITPRIGRLAPSRMRTRSGRGEIGPLFCGLGWQKNLWQLFFRALPHSSKIIRHPLDDLLKA